MSRGRKPSEAQRMGIIGHKLELPIVPSDWDVLLADLRLTDEQLKVLLKDSLMSPLAMQVRTFVYLSKNSKYVPEWLLDLLGEKPSNWREWAL